MKRGTSLTKAKATEGVYPVISGGKEPAFYCDTFNRSGETITVAGSGAGAGYVQYWTIDLYAKDCFTVKGNNCANTKYLYYCLSNMQQACSNRSS
ncbi:MAG: restriction endonuclease subunit S [Bacillota bacterium]|nr:restriction endonuclease subunit S [Bacillota bacterium]